MDRFTNGQNNFHSRLFHAFFDPVILNSQRVLDIALTEWMDQPQRLEALNYVCLGGAGLYGSSPELTEHEHGHLQLHMPD
jgi:hypothetical protein